MAEVIFPEEVPPSRVEHPVERGRPFITDAFLVVGGVGEAVSQVRESVHRVELPADEVRLARLAAVLCGSEGVRLRLNLLKSNLRKRSGLYEK